MASTKKQTKPKIYRSSDGKEFGSLEAANAHEASLKPNVPKVKFGDPVIDAMGRSGAAAGGDGTARYDPDTGEPLTASSGTARKDEKKLGKTIAETSNPNYKAPTKDLSYIENYMKDLAALERGAQSSINASYDDKQRSLATQQTRETGSTSVAIARAGGYLGNSGSGTGVMVNLATSHRAEMGELETQRQAALLASRSAYADKKFNSAKLYADTAAKLEQESYDRQQKFFESVKKEQETLKKQNDEVDIYNTIVGGKKDPQDIYAELGGKVSIDTINNFLDKSKPDVNGNAAFKYSNQDMALLMGAGLSKADVDALQTYIEENGYDEKIRSTLSPKERKIVDSIYFPKASTTPGGVGGALTISEAKSLGLPTSLIGRTEQQVIADLQSANPPAWYREYLVSGWADQSAEVDPNGLKQQWNQYRAAVLAQNVKGNDYAIGDDNSGGGGTLEFDEY